MIERMLVWLAVAVIVVGAVVVIIVSMDDGGE